MSADDLIFLSSLAPRQKSERNDWLVESSAVTELLVKFRFPPIETVHEGGMMEGWRGRAAWLTISPLCASLWSGKNIFIKRSQELFSRLDLNGLSDLITPKSCFSRNWIFHVRGRTESAFHREAFSSRVERKWNGICEWVTSAERVCQPSRLDIDFSCL